MTRLLLLVALAAGCSTSVEHTPVGLDEPLVEPTPPPPDKTPQVRAVLQPFLAARWAFDHETADQYVTDADADRPWRAPMYRAFVPRKPDLGKMRVWADHEWEIVSIEVDGDRAKAAVEVIGPDILSTARFHIRHTTRSVKFMAKMAREPRRAQERLAEAKPARRIRRIVYHLREIDGDWRVYMNWPVVHEIDESHGTEEAAELLERFDGSERSIVEDAFGQPRLDSATREAKEAVSAAEQDVLQRNFQAAIDAYNELLATRDVPDFVAGRRDRLIEYREIQKAKLAHAQVAVSSPREADEKYWVDVKNNGPTLDGFRLGVEYRRKDKSWHRSQSERRLEAGEARTVEVRRYRYDVVSVRLLDVRFTDRELQREYAIPHDQDFRRRWQDVTTSGESRKRPSRIEYVLREEAEAFDACPWPDDKPRDVRVEVIQPGRPALVKVVGHDDDDAFGACIEESASQLEFPLAADNRTLVRLYPPGHWFRGD